MVITVFTAAVAANPALLVTDDDRPEERDSKVVVNTRSSLSEICMSYIM
jgi:hypothetical protein